MELSIIVPVYNVEKYLERCIKSLLNQTMDKIEIILVNDGSTDGSTYICKKYKKLSNKIKYIESENKGCSHARNLGIKKSIGKYLMFVDSDDYVELDYCLLMYEKIEKEELDLVQCDFKIVDKEGLELKKESKKIPTDTKNFLIENNECGYIWNKIFKSKIIKKNNLKFPEKSHMYEDMIFVFKYCIHVEKISLIDKKIYYYVQNEKSVMNTITEKRIYDIFYGLDNLKEYVLKNKKEFLDVYNFIYKQRGVKNSFSILEQRVLKKEIENYKEIENFIVNKSLKKEYKKIIFYWRFRIFMANNFSDQIKFFKKLLKREA